MIAINSGSKPSSMVIAIFRGSTKSMGVVWRV
jgi:hypothetical protein